MDLFSFIVVNSFCFILVFCDLVHDVCVWGGGGGGGEGAACRKLTANSIQKSFDYDHVC